MDIASLSERGAEHGRKLSVDLFAVQLAVEPGVTVGLLATYGAMVSKPESIKPV